MTIFIHDVSHLIPTYQYRIFIYKKLLNTWYIQCSYAITTINVHCPMTHFCRTTSWEYRLKTEQQNIVSIKRSQKDPYGNPTNGKKSIWLQKSIYLILYKISCKVSRNFFYIHWTSKNQVLYLFSLLYKKRDYHIVKHVFNQIKKSKPGQN
jgi:hypothetical protein